MPYSFQSRFGAASAGSGFLAGQEEADPMSSVANLVDAMLVVAVGLMMALVVRGDIVLTEMEEIDSDAMQPVDVENIQDMANDMAASSGMSEVGSVYVDPETGTYYMLTEEGSGASGNTGAQSGSAGIAPSASSSAVQAEGETDAVR